MEKLEIKNHIRLIELFAGIGSQAMALRNMKAIDLSEKTGISKARISQYVNGVYTPKSKSTYIIAQALNVNEIWLMGIDVPMEPQKTENAPSDTDKSALIKEIVEKLSKLSLNNQKIVFDLIETMLKNQSS